jgi:hypothetical protein
LVTLAAQPEPRQHRPTVHGTDCGVDICFFVSWSSSDLLVDSCSLFHGGDGSIDLFAERLYTAILENGPVLQCVLVSIASRHGRSVFDLLPTILDPTSNTSRPPQLGEDDPCTESDSLGALAVSVGTGGDVFRMIRSCLEVQERLLLNGGRPTGCDCSCQ